VSEYRPRELAGLAAVGVAVCCALPVLLAAGVLGAAAGVVLGSTLVVATGVAVGALGLMRWRHRRACRTEQAIDRFPSTPSGGC
jgi:mercuric ion transport protein